ncbi:Hypothetical_protein [Hexamita inflata]|uniref:Hypothetical_protein n=1 Tax=Hexamita inflata TaxID=28002 RepID=A0AA86RE08_9EUKA|nr:Hypothetical protein HINF_LOCUS63891 [Hexamita inflata]
MPINCPQIFVDEDEIMNELNKLDDNQQRVLPVLQHMKQQKTAQTIVQQLLVQHAQQFALQLPINAFKSISGQLHQDNLAMAALKDTIWLTASHQNTLLQQAIPQSLLNLYFGSFSQLFTILPELSKDAQTIFSTFISNPVMNKVFQVGIAEGMGILSKLQKEKDKFVEASKILISKMK